jgi:flagellar protein FlgJ
MSSGIDSAKFYADFGGLTALNRQVKQKDPQAIREAARQFESLFTEMMLKSMRSAKLGDELGESQESDMYQDMYDQQLAVQLSQGKGLGLADMLVRQLTRRGEIPSSTGTAAGTAAAQATAAGAVGTVSRKFPVQSTKQFRIPVASPRTYPVQPGKNGTPSISAKGRRSTANAARGGTSTGAASLRERIGFVQKLEPYAQRAASALGVSTDTLIAQAALETGWGRHLASGTGSGSSNNFFGVKTGTQWQGATATASTTEYDGAAASRVAQSFRHYQSVQQGVDDYVSLLQSRGSYRSALGSGSNPSAFAGALARGGYATDPEYVHKLVATAASVRSLRTLVAAMPSSTSTPAVAAAGTQSAPGTSGWAIREAVFKLLAGMPIANGDDPA